MKGILMYSPNKENWVVEYEEDNRKIVLDVRPNRIDDLNSVGTHLQNMAVVDFQIEDIFEFPYRWAVPYVKTEVEPIPEPRKKTEKKKKVTLWLSGFYQDEVEIICEGYDSSSNGYWYFYDRDKNGSRIYLGAYPIGRTVINQIEEIEVEI